MIQPHIRCKPGDIASYVLMPGDPARVLRIGELMDEYKEIAFHREFRTITGRYKGIAISACSTGIGGPSTAIAIEELARIGARVLIRVGSCGSVHPRIRVGDLVIPEGVVREDGTSQMYVPETYPAVPDPGVFQALVKAAAELGYRYHVGITRSGDTFYARVPELYDFWKPHVLAAEMEAATLLTVARLKGLRAGVVLVVINKRRKPWESKDFTEFARMSEVAKEREARAIRVALEAVVLLDRKLI
jgi:uridine phosphorylase